LQTIRRKTHHFCETKMAKGKPPSISDKAISVRQGIRDWIIDLERRFQVSRAEVANRSGIKPSTVYRWFDDQFTHVPSYSALQRIADAFNIGMPGAPLLKQGFSEAPTEPFVTPTAELEPSPADPSDWTVTTRALELAGFLPGDVLRIDKTALPRSGDAVIADVYDFDRNAPEKRIRFYEPPYLTTRTMDPAVNGKPLIVDGERVVILGPVVRSVRLRRV
jgi:transcriptional regulator with XRE-family HTH domain